MRNVLGVLAMSVLCSAAHSMESLEQVPAAEDELETLYLNVDEVETEAATADEREPRGSESLLALAEGDPSLRMRTSAAVTGDSGGNLRGCGMAWARDEQRDGLTYSVWRPTYPVSLGVTITRNGTVSGSQRIIVRPPSQEVSLVIGPGMNHDRPFEPPRLSWRLFGLSHAVSTTGPVSCR